MFFPRRITELYPWSINEGFIQWQISSAKRLNKSSQMRILSASSKYPIIPSFSPSPPNESNILIEAPGGGPKHFFFDPRTTD